MCLVSQWIVDEINKLPTILANWHDIVQVGTTKCSLPAEETFRAIIISIRFPWSLIKLTVEWGWTCSWIQIEELPSHIFPTRHNIHNLSRSQFLVECWFLHSWLIIVKDDAGIIHCRCTSPYWACLGSCVAWIIGTYIYTKWQTRREPPMRGAHHHTSPRQLYLFNGVMGGHVLRLLHSSTSPKS